MTAQHGNCLGCGRHTRLNLRFCQRCESRIEAPKRVVMRNIAYLEKLMDRNVRKLEANAGHVAVQAGKLRVSVYLLRNRFGDGADLRRYEAAIPTWLASLEGERQPLIGRIARQRMAIDTLRRKHGIKR
jgi:hypothetical protein